MTVLVLQGYRNAYAGVTLPTRRTDACHKALETGLTLLRPPVA